MHVDAHLARTASAFGGLENSPRVLAKFRRSLQAEQAQAQAQATREPLRMNVVGTCFVRSWVFSVLIPWRAFEPYARYICLSSHSFFSRYHRNLWPITLPRLTAAKCKPQASEAANHLPQRSQKRRKIALTRQYYPQFLIGH